MKKMIFGCSLMILGIIGGTGWIIAYALMADFGIVSSATDIFPIIGKGRIDGYIVMIFYIISIIGMCIAGKSLVEDSTE